MLKERAHSTIIENETTKIFETVLECDVVRKKNTKRLFRKIVFDDNKPNTVNFDCNYLRGIKNIPTRNFIIVVTMYSMSTNRYLGGSLLSSH